MEKDFLREETITVRFRQGETNWEEWLKLVPGDPTYKYYMDGDIVVLTLWLSPYARVASIDRALKAVMQKASTCTACGRCASICHNKAIIFQNGDVHIKNCRHCGACYTIKGACCFVSN